MYEVGITIAISILALIFAAITAYFVMKKSSGNKKTKELSAMIYKGSMTFLNKEYKVLAIFMVLMAAVLWFFIPEGHKLAISFIIGGIFSALAGNIGMRIATKANAKTAWGVKKSVNEGLGIAFNSGAVMGMSVVGLGLLGVTALYIIFGDPEIIYGFGFGASSIALFARVGGGIYTKAADVGADLVGKVEAGIPEDDPRNPAVIADNVGDNVGDVAGMGADLFESYVDSIIAAMVIGTTAVVAKEGALTLPFIGTLSLGMGSPVLLPLMLAAAGIIAAIMGTFFVRARSNGRIHSALNKGIFASAIIMVAFAFLLIMYYVGNIGIFYAAVAGLASGIVIGLSTEYYTANDKKPAQKIAEASKTGAATNIIQGLSNGMLSTIIPVLAVCTAILLAYHFGGLYGIAIAAVGMLSTLGITLATDTYGPVADNAAGIAEMAGMGKDVRERAEGLDAVGNTTAAIGKGFAIGSAALTALALFVSYTQITNLEYIDVGTPSVIVGLFLGAVMPFFFSALSMEAVGKAAHDMVEEVRRQFKTIKGIMSGKAKPDYERCVDISTSAALRQMIIPGVVTVLMPIVVGMLLGPEALGGLLAGALATGFLMAVFMANAGGSWDNAKKYIEEGNLGGKGSDTHKAAVVGDTVGDPFKDTSGPSINILIKLMTIVALVFVPLFI
ncbi:sodium-translocating pyrophosphatase [Candidatus Woesearchaeota archaeon]|nr:sodium-translocating pyrophosphatase [Candidatus Woesearchaeota archaeon]